MKRKVSTLILMRHGQSVWNKRDLFTGWVDVPLSEEGVQESIEGGKKIKNIPIDIIFTSRLIRAHETLFLAMRAHESNKVPVIMHDGEGRSEFWGQIYSEKSRNEIIPVFCSWHLNERWYGELQGLNKEETRKKYGKEQVHTWRRSYDVAPPGGESLQDTAHRTIPYFQERIVPCLKEGKNVFIPAHGNSLRAIVMYLDHLTPEEVGALEIPTGVPILYYYIDGEWKKETL